VSAPARLGDEAELFHLHGDRLVRIVQGVLGAPRHVAEDACSFAWLQLLRLQPERERIVSWLGVVAVNEARRLLVAQARHAEFDEGTADSAALASGAHPKLDVVVEAHEALQHITALSPQQMRIFSLHVAGFKYEEICAATGYSWTQVNRHLVKARARLRACRDVPHEDRGGSSR
jgi:RNA polymerase sigma factor (sigma-70 family)